MKSQCATWDRPYAALRDSSGPTRTHTDAEPDPDFQRRPVGFVQPETTKEGQ